MFVEQKNCGNEKMKKFIMTEGKMYIKKKEILLNFLFFSFDGKSVENKNEI